MVYADRKTAKTANCQFFRKTIYRLLRIVGEVLTGYGHAHFI